MFIVLLDRSFAGSFEAASLHWQNAIIISPSAFRLARQGCRSEVVFYPHTFLSFLPPLSPHFISQKWNRNFRNLKAILLHKLLASLLYYFVNRTQTSENITLAPLITTECAQKAIDNKVKFIFLSQKKLGLLYLPESPVPVACFSPDNLFACWSSWVYIGISWLVFKEKCLTLKLTFR